MRMSRRGGLYVPGGAAVVVDPVFANNTWETIIAACHQNIVPDTWAAGDQKPMTIGGTEYNIDIIGKYHDTYADGSGTAPLTLQMHEVTAETYKINSSNTNDGGWEASQMRTETMPLILSQMPQEVQRGIREVEKYTTRAPNSNTVLPSVDKLFLLSYAEVTNGSSDSAPTGEGTRYEYYSADNNASRRKYIVGTTTRADWWLRTVNTGGYTNFWRVSGSSIGFGNVVTSSASAQNGVSVAFCF